MLHVRTGAQGFSLVELLTAMAVLALLVALAAPALRDLMARQQVRGAGNDLVADLQAARTQAAGSGGLVGVVARAGGWREGWEVWPDVDPDSAGFTVPADRSRLLRAHGALPRDVRMAATRGSSLDRVVFAADGGTYDPLLLVRATADTVFSVCKPVGRAQAVRVTLRASGRVESHRDDGTGGAECP